MRRLNLYGFRERGGGDVFVCARNLFAAKSMLRRAGIAARYTGRKETG